MFQFLKRHIIKAACSLRRGGRHCHFGVVFQVGGESERAFFAFSPRHRKDTEFKELTRLRLNSPTVSRFPKVHGFVLPPASAG
jgi:hypothetical protein